MVTSIPLHAVGEIIYPIPLKGVTGVKPYESKFRLMQINLSPKA